MSRSRWRSWSDSRWPTWRSAHLTMAASTVLAVEVFRHVQQAFGRARARWYNSHFMRDYLELTKPRITWLILMSTAVGYFFGHHGAWNSLQVLHTILGTALIASGTAALNQWGEREADRKMRRTADRPIPSGRLSANRALIFGILLSVAGFAELGLGRQSAFAACWACSRC